MIIIFEFLAYVGHFCLFNLDRCGIVPCKSVRTRIILLSEFKSISKIFKIQWTIFEYYKELLTDFG